MAIALYWDTPDQQTVMMDFEEEWSWDDLEVALKQADEMIDSASSQVDLIINLDGSRIPRDFLQAARSLLANPEARPNEGHKVVVGANRGMRMAYSVLFRTFGSVLQGREVLFADTTEAAREMLQDQTVNPTESTS